MNDLITTIRISTVKTLIQSCETDIGNLMYKRNDYKDDPDQVHGFNIKISHVEYMKADLQKTLDDLTL